MTDSTTNLKTPDPVQDADLLTEFEGNLSGRTTPSSFREHPLGWGMSLVCGGIGYESINAKESLINFYHEAIPSMQVHILQVLEGQDKEQRLRLFAKAMFHACAKNFLNNHGKRIRNNSSLIIYESIDKFNELNTMTEQSVKYKISSVQWQLAQRKSGLLADCILNVCGALGMPYEAMLALLNRPDLVYESFTSTFGDQIYETEPNRGFALWVLYAAARQAYANATSYVVGDMFYVDVVEPSNQDEDITGILNDVGVFVELNPGITGYQLVHLDENYCFVPDPKFVEAKFQLLAGMAATKAWDNKPQEYNAHMLQLAYVLSPLAEEFSAVLGLLQQTSSFVPDISTVRGSVPASIGDLIASRSVLGDQAKKINDKYTNTLGVKYHVNTLATNMQRTFRHFARHYKEKEWYIDSKMFSKEQKAQMKTRLFDIVLSNVDDVWTTTDVGWGN